MEPDHLSRAHIIKYHKDCIKTFGIASNEALGWKSKASQLARFKALAETGNFNGCSVLDVGCGCGDLLEFFNAQKIGCQYTGIDQVKEFIEFAGKKYEAQANSSFLLGDFWSADIGHYDYVLASGALSYHNADPNFIYKIIFHLYSLSTHGFAFNLMELTGLKGGGLVAYDKRKIIHYCCKICPQVILKDDYLPGDYTVMLYKG
jgi:SAM-dependent methyltransferase